MVMENTIPVNLDQLLERLGALEMLNKNSELEIDYWKEQVYLLRAQIYGRKSEQLNPNAHQLPLFEEEDPILVVEKESQVVAHHRKKVGRKPLPADLPRKEIFHDISESQKICSCGNLRDQIGQEVLEQLDYIPAKIQVIRHIRPKYACKSCEGLESDQSTILIAPPAPQIIPKSIASPGLLAHVITSKFVDALPLYRQEKQFSRLGIKLSRATMSSWMMQIADISTSLIELLHQEILKGPALQIDETVLQVLKEPGRSPHTRSYMWVVRGGPPDRPGVLYHYHETRSSKVAHFLLNDYEGGVQSDGYGAYDYLDHEPEIIHAGCWAHVRRKFVDVLKARGKKKSGKKGVAETAVETIKKLYAIESAIGKENLSPEETVIKRMEEAKPILEQFEPWLQEKLKTTPPKGLLGSAISYALNQWHRLETYLGLGHLRIDNNLVENAIRPFALGRKNWLFSNSPQGAKASAAMYSLIETAKANQIEPYHYLRYLFTKWPYIDPEDPEELKALLPQYLNTVDLALI